MNKLIVLLFLVINTLFLCSCSLVGSRTRMLDRATDDEKADARMEQVLEAIKNKDKDALKALFSKEALEEAEDMDGGIDYLFDLFQGDVKEKENDGLQVNESNDYGHTTKESVAFYYVNTDKEKYFFFLLDYTENTDNPDNVGLYTLCVMTEEDEKTKFSTWQEMKVAGIYKPEEK